VAKNQERIVVGMDIGTTKICTVVGEIGRGAALNVLGVGVAQSRGLAKGMVVDITETVRSISLSLERAERLSGCKIGSAYVGVAGSHVSSLNSRGVVAVSRADRVITHDDVQRAIDAARAVTIPTQREVLHVIPRSYIVDGHEGVRDPVGMAGFRLEVETHIATGAVTALQNLVRCVQRAGIEVDDLVLQPLASSEAALSEQERNLGVVLVDIGGGTTDVAIFIEGSIWHTVVLPVGGSHLTNDLSIVLKVPAEAAERLKVLYGQILPPPTLDTLFAGARRKPAPARPPPAADGDGDGRTPVQVEVAAEEEEAPPDEPPEDYLEVETFTPGVYQQVSQTLVSQILEARLEQVFGLVAAEIRRSGYDGLLPAGVVLTGGTARLPGVAELAQRVLQMPVRVSVPQGITGLTDTLDSPAYATSVGLALWATRHSGGGPHRPTAPAGPARAGRAVGRLTGWLREFLP
jgi:cell division protein FtsA